MRNLMISKAQPILCGFNIEKNEMDGASSAYEKDRVVSSVFVGKREGKRPLGRPKRRWENNIKVHLQEVRYGCTE